jgi:hypothetical protein
VGQEFVGWQQPARLDQPLLHTRQQPVLNRPRQRSLRALSFFCGRHSSILSAIAARICRISSGEKGKAGLIDSFGFLISLGLSTIHPFRFANRKKLRKR